MPAQDAQDGPLHLSTSPPLHLFTSPPLELFTSRPLDLFTSSPLHLFTSPPLDLFTSRPLDLWTSGPLDLSTPLPLYLSTLDLSLTCTACSIASIHSFISSSVCARSVACRRGQVRAEQIAVPVHAPPYIAAHANIADSCARARASIYSSNN